LELEVGSSRLAPGGSGELEELLDDPVDLAIRVAEGAAVSITKSALAHLLVGRQLGVDAGLGLGRR
jgi:hypothetical protein